jgi:hypothetical protein
MRAPTGRERAIYTWIVPRLEHAQPDFNRAGSSGTQEK